jgi:hypothetical protein
MDLDVAALVERLLEGRTLKFSAELRLSDDADGRERTRLRVETRREVGRD